MSKMKQLIELRDLAVELVDGLNAIVNEENLDQMELELDDYAIPDENPNPQPVSFSNLQQFCAKRAREGYSDQIREIIASFCVEKLSDIEPKNYLSVWESVEKL